MLMKKISRRDLNVYELERPKKYWRIEHIARWEPGIEPALDGRTTRRPARPATPETFSFLGKKPDPGGVNPHPA